MKKIAKLSMVALAASLVTGCPANDDIEKLQAQIDGLKSSVAQNSAEVAQASADIAGAKLEIKEIRNMIQNSKKNVEKKH